MKTKLLFTAFLLLALLGMANSAWADPTVLFSTSFTDSKYNVTFPTEQTGSVDVVDGGTTVTIKGYKNAAWSWSSTNGIKFTKNNLNANAGTITATSPNYCICIPLTGVNGEITVTTTNVSDAKWYYTYTTDAAQNTIVARQQASSNNTFTITGLTQSNVTVYLGMSEKQIKTISITTPAAPAVAPGAISFSPASGEVAAGTSVTLTSTGASTIVYQWGASAVGEGGDWSTVETYSDSNKPVVPATGSTNKVLSVKATNANGSTYGSASYTPVKMALKTIYSFADGIGGQAVEVDDASVETSQMSLKNTNGRIKLTAATGFKFKNGDEIEFSGSVGNTSKAYGIKYGSTTSIGTNLYVAAGQPCHVTGTLKDLDDVTSDLYIGRYDGTTTYFTTFTIRQLTAATSEAFTGVKLNGSAATEDVDYTKEGNVITLTADYTEAPSVYLVNHIVFADESIEDQNVLVSFDSHDGNNFTGTADINGTTYTVKAPASQINALKVVYKDGETTVKEELLDVTGLKVGASYTVPFRMYVEKDGALYQTTKNGSNSYYGDAVTLQYNTTVTKSVNSVDLGGGTLVLFEDLDDSGDNGASTRASNCSAYINKAYTSTSNLPAGKYNFIFRVENINNRGSYIKVGDTDVYQTNSMGKGAWNDVEVNDVIIPADGALTIVEGSAYDGYDILIAIRTGDATVSGTITPAGWSTFASSYPLDLSTISGGTAYYASSANGSTVTLKPTTATVPAGEGLMIKGTAGETFTIDVAASGAAITGNLLKGQTTTSNVAASEGSTNHYVFGYNTNNATEYGFYNLASATEVPAGKAYLETTTALGRALRIVFGDEASGINDMKREATSNNRFYNLSGQEVAQPTKGLYIVNGKKVIIK